MYIDSPVPSKLSKLNAELIEIDDLTLFFDKIFIVNNPRQVKITTSNVNGDATKITLILTYSPSTNEKKNYIESKVIDSSNIEFRIYGFDEYSKSCTQICPLGKFNNRPLYFSYCAQRINQFAVEISLQLYLGGE